MHLFCACRACLLTVDMQCACLNVVQLHCADTKEQVSYNRSCKLSCIDDSGPASRTILHAESSLMQGQPDVKSGKMGALLVCEW